MGLECLTSYIAVCLSSTCGSGPCMGFRTRAFVSTVRITPQTPQEGNKRAQEKVFNFNFRPWTDTWRYSHSHRLYWHTQNPLCLSRPSVNVTKYLYSGGLCCLSPPSVTGSLYLSRSRNPGHRLGAGSCSVPGFHGMIEEEQSAMSAAGKLY